MACAQLWRGLSSFHLSAPVKARQLTSKHCSTAQDRDISMKRKDLLLLFPLAAIVGVVLASRDAFAQEPRGGKGFTKSVEGGRDLLLVRACSTSPSGKM
jgi:hypothetical protein